MKLVGLLGIWLWLGVLASGGFDPAGRARVAEKPGASVAWTERDLSLHGMGSVFAEENREAWADPGAGEFVFSSVEKIEPVAADHDTRRGWLRADAVSRLGLLLAAGHRSQAPPPV